MANPIDAWVAERRKVHVRTTEYDEDGNQASGPGCDECFAPWPCEASKQLDVIEALVAAQRHTCDYFPSAPCALCAALHALTGEQEEQDGQSR